MADEEPDIDALLTRACGGDEAALEQALILVTPRLRMHIEQEIQARWKVYLTVEDILQETYIDACTSIAHFTPGGEDAFVRWLKRIALNNITDAIRAISRPGPAERQRSPRFLTGFGPHVTLLNTIAGTSPSLNVARPVTDAEAKAVLSERIEALLEHERLVIGRLFFEGRSAGAIGEELGKTVGAVYLIRNRAIRKLRAMFGLDAANSGGLA